MDEKISSEHLKLAALHWLRFRKQLAYVTTECGHFSADVLAADEKDLVEVEVKVSLSDLRAEFRNKVQKHEAYPNPVEYFSNKPRKIDLNKSWYPTHMYFLVTKELAQDALEIVKAVCPKYGIMYFSKPRFGTKVNEHNIHVLKTAQLLRPKGVNETIRNRIASRMASELINLRG